VLWVPPRRSEQGIANTVRRSPVVDEDGGEPVVVRIEGVSPAGFIWRGEVYRVIEVISRWVVASPWWRSESTTGIPSDPSERDVWRVEAATEGGTPIVVDLSYDRSDGSWTLTTETQ
jgi:Family of unknown function (DUF6504)